MCVKRCCSVEGNNGSMVRCPAGDRFLHRSGCTAQHPGAWQVSRCGLTQELGVEVVDENLFYARFREAVLAVHCNELSAYALQLWEGHGCSREFDGLLDVWNLYVASTFPLVVFLVCQYLCEDVGRGLVELVEVVLLRCGFLEVVRKSRHGVRGVRTSTVARFALTTFILPSLPTRASQIWSHGGVASSSTTMNRGLSHRVMPLGSSYRKMRFSKSSSS
jgi:hypothetical protein